MAEHNRLVAIIFMLVAWHFIRRCVRNGKLSAFGHLFMFPQIIHHRDFIRMRPVSCGSELKTA